MMYQYIDSRVGIMMRRVWETAMESCIFEFRTAFVIPAILLTNIAIIKTTIYLYSRFIYSYCKSIDLYCNNNFYLVFVRIFAYRPIVYNSG